MLARKLNWALPGALAVLALIAAMTLAVGIASLDRVFANQCGASCRNDYNQCRIRTKGSPSCESAFTSCMQSCIRK